MAREKNTESSDGIPPWMITYSDLMTLLLTFFVLLISMSYIDERRLRDFLIATRGDAIGAGMFNPLSMKDSRYSVQPGPMDPETGKLEFLRQMIWEDKHLDLNLDSNRYVAIISIGEETLFDPGSSLLSEKGRYVLDRISPELQNLGYPVLVAGHAYTLRDETQNEYYDARADVEPSAGNLTWKLSLARALTVYEYLNSKNLTGLTIMNEGFGEYRPKVSNNTPENREINRRVDIVLDRRNNKQSFRPDHVTTPKEDKGYEIDEFRFELDLPARPERSGSEQIIPIVRPEALEDEDSFDRSYFQLVQPGDAEQSGQSTPVRLSPLPQVPPENGEVGN